jgi:hypothetical protein
MKLLIALLALASPIYAQTNAQLSSQITSLKATVAALQKQVTLISQNPALGLGPFVSVDPNPQLGVKGPNITITGANLHIVDGTGSDYAGNGAAASGLGSIIIGYNSIPYPNFLAPGDRGASHMLIMGSENKYTQYSSRGIVTGDDNTVNGIESFVIGGFDNIVNENNSTIVQCFYSKLTGGSANVLCGGSGNSTTDGSDTSLFGGNGVSGSPVFFSSALGGVAGTVIGVIGAQ